MNLPTVWYEIFAIFPAMRKSKFPQIKITVTFFPQKYTLE